MKSLVIAALIVCSASVFARKDDHWIRYQCVANGTNGKAQGWTRNTIPAAKASALKVCNERGISGCIVKKCYERWY